MQFRYGSINWSVGAVLGYCMAAASPAKGPRARDLPAPDLSPSIFWLRMAAKLWNRALILRPDGDVLKAALLDNIRLATQADMSSAADRKRVWATLFIVCMQKLGVSWADENGAPCGVDTSNLSTILRARWTEKEWKHVQQVTDNAAWCMDPIAVRRHLHLSKMVSSCLYTSLGSSNLMNGVGKRAGC
jgi:hypothetical protein